MLTLGEPAPYFIIRSITNPQFHFNSVAGRYIILSFFGYATHPAAKIILDDLQKYRDLFDDENICFFGVSIDPEDEKLQRVDNQIPGIRFFWDFDYQVSKLYGLIKSQNEGFQFYPYSFLLDTSLRVIKALPISNHNPQTHLISLIEIIKSLPTIANFSQTAFAPVLVTPRIFEPEFCQILINLYQQNGGADSGFMRDINGETVAILDYGHKKRMDYSIQDEAIIKQAQLRIRQRLVPEIKKVFQFNVTRIERHIVACYDADTGGYFRPHRDNTTKGTAHRRFAVTINLNAEEYTGGELRFPEFGTRTYRAPTGGAVVFSCSLLHEATPVAKGTRYAYLPFLYDEEAAKIRQMNLQFLTDKVISNV